MQKKTKNEPPGSGCNMQDSAWPFYCFCCWLIMQNIWGSRERNKKAKHSSNAQLWFIPSDFPPRHLHQALHCANKPKHHKAPNSDPDPACTLRINARLKIGVSGQSVVTGYVMTGISAVIMQPTCSFLFYRLQISSDRKVRQTVISCHRLTSNPLSPKSLLLVWKGFKLVCRCWCFGDLVQEYGIRIKFSISMVQQI